MYGALDISTSGLIAQRTRIDAIAANQANQDTLRDSAGNLNPFRRRLVVLAAGAPDSTNADARELGVHVREIVLDDSPVQPKEYDPDHPDAYQDGPFKGYVAMTNVDPVMEQINALEAGRAYEANIVAAETTKAMFTQMLRLLA
ncbi:MAG: flagellar basal body rod protein FlgC [Phycisphaerales bacterium]